MLNQTQKKPNWLYLVAGWKNLDWTLLLLVVGLTIFAGFVIRSTELTKELTDWRQHWLIGSIGLGLVLILSRLRYEGLIQWHWMIYGITNLSLIIVMVAGASAKGAQRWINIGGFTFQPSEFAKVGLIITLAALLHNRSASKLSVIFRTLAITAVPWGFVFLQPDLDTAIVIGVISLAMLYWANANLGWIILMISPVISAVLFNLFFNFWIIWAIAMAVIAWLTLPWRNIAAMAALLLNYLSGHLGEVFWNILKDYQKQRLTIFLDPYQDPLGGGYHLIQSRIAIGAGQMWGQGLNEGTQTQLNFIPEQHTDFIFSAVGEEFGFVGCIIILCVYWLICLRLITIANKAKENFGSLIAVGVLAMLSFQTAINIGMTIGVVPVTGIPLPLLSYGGSSLLANFMAIAVVESVANSQQKSKS
jgi:rod shape determining protein RodA